MVDFLATSCRAVASRLRETVYFTLLSSFGLTFVLASKTDIGLQQPLESFSVP